MTFRDGSVFAMIAISMYLGFKELYLCGAGYTYQPLRVFHYYDEPLLSRALTGAERDALLEHIRLQGVEAHAITGDADAQRPIWVSHQPVDERHTVINRYAQMQGVKIYSVVPDGFESPIYSPVSGRELARRLSVERNPPARVG
jgi:hypothetical protein